LAGLGGLVPWSWRTGDGVSPSSRIARQQQHFNDRFLAACAELGNESAAVRLAAVYPPPQ
jgi:hypothetical protein